MRGGDSGLISRTRGLFTVAVGVGHTDPRALHATMFHVEQSALQNAVPARRREFLAGRAAARQAQEALGLVAQPVPVGEDRAPIWPEGMCGSISHTADTCLAAVCNDPSVSSIGLDIEEAEALPEEVLETVLNHDERRWIAQQPNPHLLGRAIFSAKECAYKAQYPLSRQLFGFEVISVTPGAGGFEAHFTRAIPPFDAGHVLRGRLSIGDGLILTGITIRR